MPQEHEQEQSRSEVVMPIVQPIAVIENDADLNSLFALTRLIRENSVNNNFHELLAAATILADQTGPSTYVGRNIGVSIWNGYKVDENQPNNFSIIPKGISVRLTPTELKVAKLLVQARGNVVTSLEFCQEIWDGRVGMKTITMNVSRIRHALSPHPEEFIGNRRGFGYFLKEV